MDLYFTTTLGLIFQTSPLVTALEELAAEYLVLPIYGHSNGKYTFIASSLTRIYHFNEIAAAPAPEGNCVVERATLNQQCYSSFTQHGLKTMEINSRATCHP